MVRLIGSCKGVFRLQSSVAMSNIRLFSVPPRAMQVVRTIAKVKNAGADRALQATPHLLQLLTTCTVTRLASTLLSMACRQTFEDRIYM